jgi:hypothetical protein
MLIAKPRLFLKYLTSPKVLLNANLLFFDGNGLDGRIMQKPADQ